jgi:hypothetical protein
MDQPLLWFLKVWEELAEVLISGLKEEVPSSLMVGPEIDCWPNQ